MHRSRLGILKVLATLILMASMSGAFSLSASAAPGSVNTRAGDRAQTAELCNALDANGDLTIDATEAAALTVDLTGDGLVTQADIDLLLAGCNGLTSVGPGLTVDVCVALQAAGLINTDGAVIDATTFTAAAVALGFSQAQISAALGGQCASLLPVTPAPTTGFVSVQKLYCPGVDATVFNPDFALDACGTGAGLFSFYLYGDNTADYWQVQVWEDGFGFIELPAGTYDVVEEGTQATAQVTVTAGETTYLTVANPGTAPAPRDGTVNVSAFVCNNISDVVWTSDGFMAAFALPTTDPACEPGTGTFTFYLIGDGTDAHWQVVADSTASITLAPGDYEVVEEGTQARTFITVYPGDFINLDLQIPAGGTVVPGNSVNIVKFYCDTVTSTEFLSLSADVYSARDELPGAPDCMSGAATFTFYLVGDGTNDYAQIWVNGAGSIGLEPGTYEVVEEETQAHYTFDVLDGENTMLVVNNPMPASGEVPGGPGQTPAETPSAGAPSAGGTSAVSKLPSTGSGHADSTSAYMLAAAAAALIAGAGAFALRREEAA